MAQEVYIGLMSGTSVDGLDMCAVTFGANSYEILAAETVEYSEPLRRRLLFAHQFPALELAQLHVDFGVFCGKEVKKFVARHNLKPSYVASHGQTVFHTPGTGLTLQIGSGAHIAAESGISTVCDFRSLDVACGGQGAPLVPIGDELLFPEYDYCLNIGGFANVSTNCGGKRIAWDICPANIVLNAFAQKRGRPFDEDGALGKQGSVDAELLERLNELPFYSERAPKSLGREWVDEHIIPLFEQSSTTDGDKFRTYYEHCAIQIGKTLQGTAVKTLCTGGGVKNSFLMERIAHYAESELVVPEPQLIDYKEALIFAYLGYLRIHKTANSLASVTGARKDVCGGVVWLAE